MSDRIWTAAVMAACIASLSSASARPVADALPHAVVDAQSQLLLGGWLGDRWLSNEAISKPLKGGETYRFYSLMRTLGTGKGGKPMPTEPDVDPHQKSVEIKPTPPGEEIIGVGGSWNALPRKPVMLNPRQSVYVNAVAQLLRDRGLRHPKVRITQIMKVDLEGDGTQEVLISASSRPGPPDPHARSGDYSLVAVRKIVNGRVRTLMLGEETHVKVLPEQWQILTNFTVPAVLDLNGDGTMEVLVRWRYYEGMGVDAYSIQGGTAKKVLGGGIGV